MAALRPCPSVHVVVGARRPCISSPASSSLRIVPALGRQGGRSTSLVGHWLAGSRAAPRLRDRHRHATDARKGAADWPFGVEPDDDRMVQSVISVCNRACNRVADSLAAYGASLVAGASKIFIDHVPEFVIPLVSGDKPGAHV